MEFTLTVCAPDPVARKFRLVELVIVLLTLLLKVRPDDELLVAMNWPAVLDTTAPPVVGTRKLPEVMVPPAIMVT